MSALRTKPAGLTRFTAVIITKRPGRCVYCGTATVVGTDFATLNSAGKWLATCTTCAASVVEQVKGTVRDLAGIDCTGVDVSAIVQPDQAELLAVMAGQRPEAVALAMLRTVFATRSAVRAAVGASKPAAAPAATVTPGLYVMGDPADWSSYWLVREGKRSGHCYAMRLATAPVEGVKLNWDYVRGGMSAVARSARPATADEYKWLGDESHYCCFCSTELTDDQPGHSIDRGYGPICAKRHGLPWGD